MLFLLGELWLIVCVGLIILFVSLQSESFFRYIHINITKLRMHDLKTCRVEAITGGWEERNKETNVCMFTKQHQILLLHSYIS